VNKLDEIMITRVGSHQGQHGLVDGVRAQRVGYVSQPARFRPDGTARPPWSATSEDGRITINGDSKAEVAETLITRLGFHPIDPDQVTPSLI